jgi:hypothetical protein
MVANYKQPITSPEYHLSNSCKQLRETELQRVDHGMILYIHVRWERLAVSPIQLAQISQNNMYDESLMQ